MKRRLIVEVDAGEKTCAPCNRWHANTMMGDVQFECGVYGGPLVNIGAGLLERCPACLAAEQSTTKGTEEVREVLAEPVLSWRFEEPVHFDGEGNVTMSLNQFNILLRGLQAVERQSTTKRLEPLVEASTQSEYCQGQRNEPTTERNKLREDLEEADGTIILLRRLLADAQSSYEESSSLAEELLAAIGLDRHDFAEALPPAPSQEEMHKIFLDAERIAKATGYQVTRSKVVQALGHQWRATQAVLRDVLAAQIEWPDGALSDVATELEDKLRERAEWAVKGP
jgi:hypothetical protein